MSDEGASSQERLGRVLSGIGSVWILLFIVARFLDVGGTPLGDILGFFGGSFFVPIALLFAGRAIRRRSGQVPGPVAAPQQQRPTPRPPAPASPVAKPAPRREERTVATPQPVEPDIEKLAMAVGFDDEMVAEPGSVKPGAANKEQFKARYEPTYRAKSSADMVAEARDRLKKKPG